VDPPGIHTGTSAEGKGDHELSGKPVWSHWLSSAGLSAAHGGAGKEKGKEKKEGIMANILIVDEKPGVRNVFAEGLAWEGYKVFNTGDPAAIRKTMQLIRPDLVIIDPFFGGAARWDALEEIKGENPRAPIIVVTSSKRCREEPRLALASAVLIKSFYFDDLKKKTAEFLRPKAPEKKDLPRDQMASS
jgi:DNA-binding NtrC family response regulator